MISRRGFAIITVLWVMTVASVVALGGVLAGRNSVGAGRNRVESTRSYWRAQGCARRAQAGADDALISSASPEAATVAWRKLDSLVAASPLVAGCETTLEPTGTRLDINSISAEMLERLLAAVGQPEAASSLAGNIIAARDTQPIGDVRDLARVRGMIDLRLIDSLVSVEPGRVDLLSAPATVLLAVPGFTQEAADAVLAQRAAGNTLTDLSQVLSLVSQTASTSLIERYPDAVRLTTVDPDAWIIRSRSESGFPETRVEVTWRAVRSTRGLAITRVRRSR